MTVVGDKLALRELADRYALAVDEKDMEALTSLFVEKGTIISYSAADPTEQVGYLEGHDAIRGIRQRMVDRYDRTFHFVGTGAWAVDGDEATGRVYCMAHHLKRKDTGVEDYVMSIRYEDRYERGADGEWRFAERSLRVQWTERRALGERTHLGPPQP